MVRLKHECGKRTTVKSRQVLGDLSPLEFNSDGYAVVEDDAIASQLAGMHSALSIDREDTSAAPSSDVEESDESDDTGTCQEIKSDGEVCGRDLPCGYHSD